MTLLPPFSGEPVDGLLRRAIAPVLADLTASGLSPDIRAEAHEERDDRRTPGPVTTAASDGVKAALAHR